MHGAAENGHVGVVRRLLECGADVNSGGGRNAQLALRRSISGGHPETVRALLESGVDMDATIDEEEDGGNGGGETAMELAQQLAQDAVVAVLLEHRAANGLKEASYSQRTSF